MIIKQKETPDSVAFSDLKEGETFQARTSNRNILWMKIQNIITESDYYNAIDLSDGGVESFDDSDLVTPVKAIVLEE